MYAISVTGGKEFQVLEELKKIDGIKALLPTNMIVIRKAGIWREKEKVLIPGYIFIKCKFNYDLYYKVKSIPCVTSWIGKGVPSVMSIEDESFIEFLSNNGEAIPVQSIISPFVKKSVIKKLDKHARRITATLCICDKVHTVTFGYKK